MSIPISCAKKTHLISLNNCLVKLAKKAPNQGKYFNSKIILYYLNIWLPRKGVGHKPRIWNRKGSKGNSVVYSKKKN